MYALLADSEGIWQYEGDAADWSLLIAAILFVVAAILAIPRTVHHTADPNDPVHHHVDTGTTVRAWARTIALVAAALTALGIAFL